MMQHKGWARKRLRFFLQKQPSSEQCRALEAAETVSFLPMEAVSETGIVDVSREKAKEDVSTGYPQFFDGDVLVARITPCFENGKGAIVNGMKNGIGYGSTEFHVLRPNNKLIAPFLYYITQSADFRTSGEAAMTGAAGQKRVPDEFIQNYVVDIPSVESQKKICDFLDKKLLAIDQLFEAKQNLLGTLSEKRRALITHAVTKGLDPKAPMRDSGIPWLGKIPAHWKATKMSRLFRQIKRLGFPYLTVLSVYREFGVIERATRDDNANKVPEDLEKYQLVEIGDLVVNKMKAWQGSLGISDFLGITSPDYVVFQPSHKELPAFLHYRLRASLMTSVYLSISNGIRTSQWRIEPDRFLDLPIFLPDAAEQKLIVDHIQVEIAKLDNLAEATRKTIALLQERRSALISAAVTGQMEIGEKA